MVIMGDFSAKIDKARDKDISGAHLSVKETEEAGRM